MGMLNRNGGAVAALGTYACNKCCEEMCLFVDEAWFTSYEFYILL